jgi:tol-pal system protein YbgF
MTCAWKYALPLLLLVIGSGCAAPAKQTPPPPAAAKEATATTEDTALKNLREQLDRNNTVLQAAQQQIAVLQQRLKDMEVRLDAAATNESAAIQEIKESLAALNQHFEKPETSSRERKAPAQPQRKGAGVFKPDGFEVESAYKEALADYTARKFEDAIRGFTEIITIAPASSLADNAQYWIGESYYSLKNYEKALEAFNKVFSYTNTNKAADARVKIGMTYQMMGKTDEARKQLNRVLSEYPDSNAAKIAAARLEALEKQ